MARRIAVAVTALIAVLIGTVVVPLGLLTSGQYGHDFADDAIGAASTLASITEEHLDDNVPATGMLHAMAGLRRHGDLVAAYLPSGRQIAGDKAIPGVSPSRIRAVTTGPPGLSYPTDDRLLILTPVRDDAGTALLGVVALSRPTTSLDHSRAVLWILLGVASLAGLLASALVATGLARWAVRPLGALQAAAGRLGTGELEARSPASTGPEEVRRLAVSFNQMAGRLEALVSGHQAMMADVSHQLRTPLAALRLRLDVLAQDAPGHLAEELAGAQEEVARLSRLVSGLLAVARAQNVTAAAVPVPVHAVIKDRSAAWRPAADEKSVTLAATAIEPLTAQLGDGHLEQILDNLLANAIEAVPAGGHVHVGASQVDDRIRLIVADDGPGMTPAQQRTAFRRFASQTPGGTGLGLAIVHRLVTADGGSAELSQTPGGGLTITLDLPSVPRERATRRPAMPSAGPRSLATLNDS